MLYFPCLQHKFWPINSTSVDSICFANIELFYYSKLSFGNIPLMCFIHIVKDIPLVTYTTLYFICFYILLQEKDNVLHKWLLRELMTLSWGTEKLPIQKSMEAPNIRMVRLPVADVCGIIIKTLVSIWYVWYYPDFVPNINTL